MCSLFVFKQNTAYEMRISDWSSDVCSSDLPLLVVVVPADQADDGKYLAGYAVGDDLGRCIVDAILRTRRGQHLQSFAAAVLDLTLVGELRVEIGFRGRVSPERSAGHVKPTPGGVFCSGGGDGGRYQS